MAQDPNSYLLDGASLDKLREMWKWYERQARNAHPPRYRRATARPASPSWLGVLNATLNYHGSASVQIYSFDSGLGYFTDSGTSDTCYGWLMLSGDSIPSNTQVVGCYVSGKRVVFDAACNTGT